MTTDGEGRAWIGNQSSFAAVRFDEPFDFALEHHFDAYEWFPDYRDPGFGWKLDHVDAAARLQVRTTAREQGLRLSVHAPLHLSVLHREAARRLEEMVIFATDIGASLINVHLELDPRMESEEEIESFARAVMPLAARVSRGGMVLTIENTPVTGPEHFNRLFAVLRGRLSLQRLGMCFDVGHANLYQGTRNDYLGYFDQLEPHVPIRHVHLHENFGDRDSHLVVFSGSSAADASGIEGLVGRLRQRRFAGSIILEQWPQRALVLVEARRRLVEMFAASREPPCSQPPGPPGGSPP